jgi:hypothetical protein
LALQAIWSLSEQLESRHWDSLGVSSAWLSLAACSLPALLPKPSQSPIEQWEFFAFADGLLASYRSDCGGNSALWSSPRRLVGKKKGPT